MTGSYEALPIGIIEADHGLRVISVNDRFRDLFRCVDGDIANRPFESLLSRDRKTAFRLHRAISSYSGGTVDVGLCSFNFSGTAVLARLRFCGDTAGWTFFVEDVSQPADTYLDLAIRMRRWEIMLSDSTDAYVILDAANRIVDYNRNFFELMGYASAHGVPLNEEAVSLRDITTLPHDESLSGLLAAVRSPAKEAYETTTWYKSHLVNAKFTPVTLSSKGYVGAVLVFRELTAQNEIEHLRVKTAHYSGVSEVITGVLHNIGNVLNSARIGAETARELISGFKMDHVLAIGRMLGENRSHLAEFLTEDPKGKLLPDYCVKLADALSGEQKRTLAEMAELQKKLDSMRDIIDVQQNFAKGTAFTESVSVEELVGDALNLQAGTLARHGIGVERRIPTELAILAQKAKLIHVLMNLVINARHALKDTPPEERFIVISAEAASADAVTITVADKGYGIEPGDLDKIFAHGFTTRADGHGFGLHFCATAMIEMNGKITVHSDGKGSGASFTLTLPRGETRDIRREGPEARGNHEVHA